MILSCLCRSSCPPWTTPNKLIDRKRYKRYRRTHFNYFKTIQRFYLFATSADFIQTRLKKICNFLVGSSFQTNDQTGTFTCARSRCKTRTQYMAVCGLPLYLGSLESRKTLEQKLIFQIGILNPHGINECSSFTYFIFRETCFSSCHERGTKKKFWVPMRNRTSYLRIPCSDALPLSHGERGPLRSSYNTRPAYC